jgi:alanine dehydrogenase
LAFDSNSKDKTLKTILLSRDEIEKQLNMTEVMEAVENAFKLKAQGKAIMPCKIYLDLPQYNGDFRAMPAYIDGSAGMKWVSVYPDNRQYNMPAVMALIILSDPSNSYPLAIMDGTHITNMRTAAAGGVAVKYLARKNASVIGMVGAGKQAETQLLAISEILPEIKEVKVFSLSLEMSQRFAREMGDKLNLDTRPVETVEAAADADVVVTTTYATSPVVLKRHIKPGTHINAIGADAEGKQELEATLLSGARVIIDDLEQACHSGEINVPLARRQIKVEDIYCSLGEVITGMKKGRENDTEITVFDSTGLAIQDIVCAKLVYEKARGEEIPAFDFFALD